MRSLLLPLALAAPALGGCLQLEEIVTVFPDGSGKIQLQLSFRKTMIKMLEESGKAQGIAPADLQAELADPSKFFQNSRGITAVRAGAPQADGEWIRSSATAYFEDINAVRSAEGKPGGFGLNARFADGALLLSNPLHDFHQGFQRSAAQRGTTPEQMQASLEFLKPLMEGLRIRFRVVGPGPLTEMSGFMVKDGATASSEITGDTLIAMSGAPESAPSRRLQALLEQRESRVAWAPEDVDDARHRAFKTELAEAKAVGNRPTPGLAPPPGPAPAPEKPRPLGEDSGLFTDDEVEKLFIGAQLKIAREHIDRGQKDKARETLQGILKDYPKARAAQEAKKLLEKLKE